MYIILLTKGFSMLGEMAVLTISLRRVSVLLFTLKKVLYVPFSAGQQFTLEIQQLAKMKRLRLKTFRLIADAAPKKKLKS